MIKIYETEGCGVWGKSYSPSHTLSVMPFEFKPSIDRIDDPTLKPHLETLAEERGGEVTYHPESDWEESCYFPSGWGEPKRKLFASITEESDNEWVHPSISRFL